jgi:hypothetical protein
MDCTKIAMEVPMSVTFDQVQVLTDQLSSLDRARLAAYLNAQLVLELATYVHHAPSDAPAVSDAWTKLLEFRRDMEALGTAAPDFAAQLDRDRQERQLSLDRCVLSQC